MKKRRWHKEFRPLSRIDEGQCNVRAWCNKRAAAHRRGNKCTRVCYIRWLFPLVRRARAAIVSPSYFSPLLFPFRPPLVKSHYRDLGSPLSRHLEQRRRNDFLTFSQLARGVLVFSRPSSFNSAFPENCRVRCTECQSEIFKRPE
jgi:hypothetical protein